MHKPYIDIILLSYGKFLTTTKPCLDSLLPDSNNGNFRLTVVDNCSPDNSAKDIREYLKDYPQVPTIFLESNTGFAGGMNFGASQSTAEWLLLVNSDTIFLPGALDVLFLSLKSQLKTVGMVGPITNAAGNGQNYKISGETSSAIAEAMQFQNTPSHALIPCYRLDFFCVAIRRSLWEKLNGLDPIFGLGYYEDTDFSMRAKFLGYRMMICEDAFVYHVGGSSFSTNPKARELIKRNKKIFMQRHPHASLYHRREGNLQAIEEYATLRNTVQWNEGLEIRLKYRIESLLTDLPRSPIKKWLWNRKVGQVLAKLG